ncbi:alpha/beta hydrolase [Pleionea sediminis]|uniref:alpha/beta hydrolase n=1 Tax=Pleionea sediminis TaxID=2569479 RepID=UPI001185413A|nr:alpha/beta hydrolase [Pleionea sediminis]
MSIEYFHSDDTKLAYRWFPVDNAKGTVICYHGSSLTSVRYTTLARLINRSGYNVCLPDWRGHGESGGAPGDIEYVGQLEQDVGNLIEHLSTQSKVPIILGGHSGGSLIALRYLNQFGCDKITAYFSLSPTMMEFSETSRYDKSKGDFVYRIKYARRRPYFRQMPKQAGRYLPKLSRWKFLIALFIPFFRKLKVLNFPAVVQASPNEAMSYSFRLLQGYSVRNYPELLSSINVPSFFCVGDNDDVISSQALEMLYSWYVKPNTFSHFEILPRLNHMSVISGAGKTLGDWLKGISSTERRAA